MGTYNPDHTFGHDQLAPFSVRIGGGHGPGGLTVSLTRGRQGRTEAGPGPPHYATGYLGQSTS